jgi:prevent-host-death family protein
MSTIGIRELRQNASVYLRRVASGETLRIADRGRAVALLTPLGRKSGLARLEAESRLAPSRADLLALGPPARGRPRVARPSKALGLAREHER